jgi:hypothetical protein
MRAVLDFSIFDSPTSAWGHASGEVELPRKPAKPSDVEVPRVPQEFIDFPTEVERVWDEAGSTFISFNVFAKNAEAAAQIGRWLESALGLDAWPYREE